MASMSLNFILCDPEDVLAVNSREQVKATIEGESSVFVNSIDSNCSVKSGSLAPRQAIDDQKSHGVARKLNRYGRLISLTSIPSFVSFTYS